MNEKENANWFNELPSWSKIFIQLGFAALVALLFVLDSRDRSAQLREFQQNAIVTGREDRQFFREELKQMREDLRATTLVLQQTIDKLKHFKE